MSDKPRNVHSAFNSIISNLLIWGTRFWHILVASLKDTHKLSPASSASVTLWIKDNLFCKILIKHQKHSMVILRYCLYFFTDWSQKSFFFGTAFLLLYPFNPPTSLCPVITQHRVLQKFLWLAQSHFGNLSIISVFRTFSTSSIKFCNCPIQDPSPANQFCIHFEGFLSFLGRGEVLKSFWMK